LIEQQTFNNRYRLDSKLGEGGMATVYCGTDTVLRRRVAIKVLRDQYAADAEFVRRFYQEAESAARLSHPNIVNTYDVGQENDTYFIVMELVDGSSLGEIIAADGRLPEPVALDYAIQIASGLAYAHRTGLLHRDIKPANILVTKDDVVKLSDFGIARAVSEHTMALTKPGLVMGSVFYISPEQALGHELHETSDLYSVGVVLYQMLTGKLPYSGESPVTVALKHVGDPVPRIDTRDLGVSPALAAIVNRLLQKDPGHRFASASELATALREARERPSVPGFRIADDAPTQAHRITRTPPPRRSPLPDRPYDDERVAQRSPWPIIALIALLLAATGIGYYLFGRPLPVFNSTIAVGDYRNMTDAQAQQAVVNAGLRSRFVKSPSDTVPANHVIRQNPLAGTKVDKNSLVELVISNGKPMVGLADVRGYSMLDAQRTLQALGFAVTVLHKFDSSPKDNVIDEEPKAGTKIPQASRITLLVSNGPQPVAVPNFVGLTVDNAKALAAKLGLSLNASQQAAVNGVPANTIASQNPSAGAQTQKGGVVFAVVSTGVQSVPAQPLTGPQIAVPAVAGQPYQNAIAAITGSGFRADVQFSISPNANGTIAAQDPPPATQLSPGSSVTLTLPVTGEVPDTEGMPVERAQATLAADGYSIGSTQYTTTLGAGGRVVGTNPAVGTPLRPGSSVVLIVNGNPQQ
jgi:beta-lactam-binding protein with PASTA domain/tRNA A-37 threonylcarbamoyl transferase component Bud32